MTLTHILDLIAVARNRAAVKQSLGPSLAREDDHLLRDIGLTREELLALRRGENLSNAQASTLRFHSTPTLRGLPVGASA